MTKFWLGEENFPQQNIFPDKIFPNKVIVFLKLFPELFPVVMPSEIRTVIHFYAKALKRSPEKRFWYIVDLAFIGQIIFSRNFEND